MSACSCRPISIRPSLITLFEKLLHRRIIRFLADRSVILDNQYRLSGNLDTRHGVNYSSLPNWIMSASMDNEHLNYNHRPYVRCCRPAFIQLFVSNSSLKKVADPYLRSGTIGPPPETTLFRFKITWTIHKSVIFRRLLPLLLCPAVTGYRNAGTCYPSPFLHEGLVYSSSADTWGTISRRVQQFR